MALLLWLRLEHRVINDSVPLYLRECPGPTVVCVNRRITNREWNLYTIHVAIVFKIDFI